jgi:mRNA interferase MazF
VTIALSGDDGKSRPALVIQSELFDAHPSVTVLPVTGELRSAPLFRIAVAPSAVNGRRKPSQVMVDKPQTVARSRIGRTIGRLDDEVMLGVTRPQAVVPGFVQRGLCSGLPGNTGEPPRRRGPASGIRPSVAWADRRLTGQRMPINDDACSAERAK